jgi:hypothetical protein
MRSPWKLALLLYSVLSQLALLRAMTHSLFSPTAGASLARSVPVNICAAFVGIAMSALLFRVFKRLFLAKDIDTRSMLASGGLCGIVATAVTYEVLVFALSIAINFSMGHSEGAASSLMMFVLTAIGVHSYTFLAFLPVAGLGFVSGVVPTWFLLRVYRAEPPISKDTPLVPTNL